MHLGISVLSFFLAIVLLTLVLELALVFKNNHHDSGPPTHYDLPHIVKQVVGGAPVCVPETVTFSGVCTLEVLYAFSFPYIFL